MIRCTDIGKIYQQARVGSPRLPGCRWRFPGRIRGGVGQSGSGKSTLLHLIGGLDRPSSGELLVDGRLIGQMADDQYAVSPQPDRFHLSIFNLLPTLTAAENIALPFVLDGRSKAEADARAAALLPKSVCNIASSISPRRFPAARSARGHRRRCI